MLPRDQQPRVVTTLHGTDTLILGRDPSYGPAIRYAVNCSDTVTTVSAFLQGETRRLLGVVRPIEVIHNFFIPRAPRRSRQQVRRDLGLDDGQVMVIHLSNLRPLKRVDLLLEVAARMRPRDAFKLVILAGDDFAPFAGDVQRLGLNDRVVVRERVDDIEEYLQASDLGLFTSETESFCLAILEVMWFASPSIATNVGGIPEVIEDNVTGILTPFGDVDALVGAAEALIQDPARRAMFGQAAQQRARKYFSADVIIPRYEALYRRTLGR
jgi:N-acetyl-alpha-D-glucosaminyl L-malate synthase BshA